jgi:Cu/Ag efflux pump CusA
MAMIPLSESAFWGPMALTIMGGLSLATLMTLFLLPAIYALWFCRSLGPTTVPSMALDAAPQVAAAAAE